MRPTPTPWPTLEATSEYSIDGEITSQLIEDNIVQGWNKVNTYTGFDFVYWTLIVFVLLMGMMSLVKRIRRL
jgi:hypothetical protein